MQESSFWTLDFWGNITNLIGVVILGMAVPVGKWLITRREKIMSDARKREDQRIAEICKQFTEPMIKKLDNISTKVDYMDKVFQNKVSFDRDGQGDGESSHYEGGGGGTPGNRGSGPQPHRGSRERPRSRRYDSYVSDDHGAGSPFDEDGINHDMR